MQLTMRIENVYRDQTLVDVRTVRVREPEFDEDIDEWADDQLFPHTGTGSDNREGAYFVEVTDCDEYPALVGSKWEWGI